MVTGGSGVCGVRGSTSYGHGAVGQCAHRDEAPGRTVGGSHREVGAWSIMFRNVVDLPIYKCRL